MTIASDFVEETAEDGVISLRFSGDLSIAGVDEGEATRLDLTDIGYVDTVGAWLIYRTARDMGAEVVGADDEAKRLMTAVGRVDVPTEMRPDPPNPVLRVISDIGESTGLAITTFIGLIGFFGAVVSAAFSQMERGYPAF